MITKTLGGILVYSLLIYATIVRGPQWDFYPIKVTPIESAHNVGVFLVLGIVLRLVYDVLRYILKIVTLPINRMTLGILHIVLNIAVLYLMPYVFSMLQTGVGLEMGTIIEIALFSIGLSFVRSFIK